MTDEFIDFIDDAHDIRRVFGDIPSTVAAVGAVVDGTPVTMVVSSFTVGVSHEPPMVSVAIQRTSTTWPVLARAARLGVSVLGESHASKTRQLASRDSAGRLADIAWHQNENGAIFLEGSPIWLECFTQHEYPAGDHAIIVLRVERVHREARNRALVWTRDRASC
ncbi:flavin reductase family protein [Catenulispora sp. NF23]|uniref:Flavin reductase family protein n=1 Tax=Catenulispora pinistramenti TaxID=2705254 RepID=A0ABS5L0Q1_9ACTN|nr:flavin reductase family protein [Catenulispora pinistramenti]MBS2535395.1 flavin reductase family protein [Catenulispora pinistramenti]MBS2551921.1 flavin reductase family protein [Catenulispora pinistramenti]